MNDFEEMDLVDHLDDIYHETGTVPLEKLRLLPTGPDYERLLALKKRAEEARK